MLDSKKKLSAVALATAAAMVFSVAPLAASQAADTAKVKCEGVNSCKGTSKCKTANNECAGHNKCKGQGVLEMTQAECDAAKAKAKKS